MKIPLISINGPNKVHTGHRFLVLFDIYSIAFQSVSGIRKSVNATYFNEGGSNNYPIRMKNHKDVPTILVFKRGLMVRRVSTELAGLAPDIVAGLLNPQKALEGNTSVGFIFILDDDREMVRFHSFISKGQIDWQVSDLNAQDNNVVIESLTIACSLFI